MFVIICSVLRLDSPLNAYGKIFWILFPLRSNERSPDNPTNVSFSISVRLLDAKLSDFNLHRAAKQSAGSRDSELLLISSIVKSYLLNVLADRV